MADNIQHTVPVLGGGQATFEQCWLASFGMLLKYHGQNPSSIEDKLRGAGINVDDAKKNGLADTDYKKAGTALGTKMYAGSPYKEEHWYNPGLSTGCQRFLELLKDGPLWVSRYVGSGYHAVVATGYDDTNNGYIIYNNPFPGPNNAIEVRTLLANVFVRHITNAMGSIQGF